MAVDDVRRGHVLPLAGQLDAALRPRRPAPVARCASSPPSSRRGTWHHRTQPSSPTAPARTSTNRHSLTPSLRSTARLRTVKVVLADGFLRVVQPVAHVADVPQHVAGAVRGRAQREFRDGGAALARGVPAEEQWGVRGQARARAVHQEHQEQRALQHGASESLLVPVGKGRRAGGPDSEFELELPVPDERGHQRRPFRARSVAYRSSPPFRFRNRSTVTPSPVVTVAPLGTQLVLDDVARVAQHRVHRGSEPKQRVAPERALELVGGASRPRGRIPPDLNPPSSSVPLSRKNPSSMWDSTLKITRPNFRVYRVERPQSRPRRLRRESTGSAVRARVLMPSACAARSSR